MRYLLAIDSAGDVVLADVDGDVRMPIGEPLAPDQPSRVVAAAWSPAGQWTAWSVASDHPDGLREIRLHVEETDEAGVLAESVSAFYLCPSPCGRWLSHLSVGPLGLELALSHVRTGEVRVVERGQPLFWSWSPDASSVAVHVENRVLVASLGSDPPRVLTEDAGPFVAPWWLDASSVAYCIGDRIVAAGPDGKVDVLAGPRSSGRFSPDRDGRRIAHIERAAAGGRRLCVVDLVAGEHRVVTSEPVAGFFWSPDGSLLATLVARSDGRVHWLVFDGAKCWSLSPFRPTRSWMVSVLPFFEQYAQSHTHWSPDGTRLVVPAVADDDTTGMLVQDVGDPRRSRWLPDADLVWWA